MDIGLRLDYIKLIKHLSAVSILVVMDIGLRQLSRASLTTNRFSLNPCCDGYRSATYGVVLTYNYFQRVSILVVMDIGVRLDDLTLPQNTSLSQRLVVRKGRHIFLFLQVIASRIALWRHLFRQVIVFRQMMRDFMRNISAVGGAERPLGATHEW